MTLQSTRIACYDCLVEMKCVQNGIYVIEQDDKGYPYKLWSADLWMCPECGATVIRNFADRPICHYSADRERFDKELADARAVEAMVVSIANPTEWR